MRHDRIRLLAVSLLLGLAVAAVVASLTAGPRPAGWIGEGDGRFGWRPDPAGVREFLAELPEPTFARAGAETVAKAQGVDTFLYRSAHKAHQALYGRPWVVERQGIGDCVSWGWAHGIFVAQCVDWETGRLANPPPFPSTEAIYGGSRVEARGKSGDGKLFYAPWWWARGFIAITDATVTYLCSATVSINCSAIYCLLHCVCLQR